MGYSRTDLNWEGRGHEISRSRVLKKWNVECEFLFHGSINKQISRISRGNQENTIVEFPSRGKVSFCLEFSKRKVTNLKILGLGVFFKQVCPQPPMTFMGWRMVAEWSLSWWHIFFLVLWNIILLLHLIDKWLTSCMLIFL